jgi:DNA-directed RNA polymerase specialized sigma24 family protein
MGQGMSKSQTEDSFLAIERQSMVHSAIELMGNPCRRLLTMLFYDDPRPGYAAVARELSIPQGSIGPTRARCLEKLMNTLEQMGFSET